MPAPLPGNHNNNYGFTLIELSIVLVIIGLIVGGVLVGRDLIKAAAIRAQISQVEKYQTTVNTFKIKYGYLPGDIPPAQASQLGFFTFTGTYAGRTDNTTSFFVKNMCGYGDNNGRINDSEKYVFWQHLSEAGLVEGKFGGSASGNHLNNNAAGYNSSPCSGGEIVNLSGTPILPTPNELDMFLPKARLNANNVGVLPVVSFYNGAGVASYYIDNSQKSNFFFLYSTADSAYSASRATPYETYSIDIKIDDGFPMQGTVREFIAI